MTGIAGCLGTLRPITAAIWHVDPHPVVVCCIRNQALRKRRSHVEQTYDAGSVNKKQNNNNNLVDTINTMDSLQHGNNGSEIYKDSLASPSSQNSKLFLETITTNDFNLQINNNNESGINSSRLNLKLTLLRILNLIKIFN